MSVRGSDVAQHVLAWVMLYASDIEEVGRQEPLQS